MQSPRIMAKIARQSFSTSSWVWNQDYSYVTNYISKWGGCLHEVNFKLKWLLHVSTYLACSSDFTLMLLTVSVYSSFCFLLYNVHTIKIVRTQVSDTLSDLLLCDLGHVLELQGVTVNLMSLHMACFSPSLYAIV